MKPVYVADLQDGQAIQSLFLVREKEIRTSQRTGRSWLHVELADRTGTIGAKMWDNFAQAAPRFERDDIVRVRARVKLYNEAKELALDEIEPAAESEYDLEDFLPRTKEDVERLYARLLEFVAGIGNKWVRRLLESVVADPEIARKLKRAPAAMTMHHAYLGGLLEHIVSLCGLCRRAAEHYREVDADLLCAGAILHDIGKIDELACARSFAYTTQGQLLGHILIALALVRKKVDAIPDFPLPLAILVEHLIASHHGSYEFGSPRLPMFREAVLLYYLDDLDSKMAAMRCSLEAAEGPAEWTDRNPSLRRSLLRTDVFLKQFGGPPAGSPPHDALFESGGGEAKPASKKWK